MFKHQWHERSANIYVISEKNDERFRTKNNSGPTKYWKRSKWLWFFLRVQQQVVIFGIFFCLFSVRYWHNNQQYLCCRKVIFYLIQILSFARKKSSLNSYLYEVCCENAAGLNQMKTQLLFITKIELLPIPKY